MKDQEPMLRPNHGQQATRKADESIIKDDRTIIGDIMAVIALGGVFLAIGIVLDEPAPKSAYEEANGPGVIIEDPNTGVTYQIWSTLPYSGVEPHIEVMETGK